MFINQFQNHFTQTLNNQEYFSPNGCKGRRIKENLTQVNAVFADWDFKPDEDKDGNPLEPTGAKKPDFKQFLLDLEGLPTPTYIVESGNGWHVYWLLEEPIMVDDDNRAEMIKQVEGIHRHIVQNYGSDNAATDVLRLLRPPGSVHSKQPEHPFTVEVVVDNSDTRYTLDELVEAIPPVIKEDVVVEYGELTDDVQARLDRMLEKSHIKKLWDGNIPDDKKSESDSSLCCQLAFWLAKDPTAMEAAWLQSPLGQREKTQKRADYRKMTIDDAIGKTKDVYTPKKKIDSLECPERDKYLSHLVEQDWDNTDWVKKLNLLSKKYVANFHKFFASKYPHLLFEVGEDKSYWQYTDSGVYEGVNFSTVRGYVARLMFEEKLDMLVNEATVKNVLLKYRAIFSDRGATFDSFVSDDNHFHVSNGWLNTKTRELTPHTPNRRSLFKSKVSFNPNAIGDVYNKMLDKEYQLPADAVRVVDQFSGYLLTHNVDQQKMLVFEGRPGCGKSTLPRIWLDLLGEKATTASLASLSNSEVRFMGGNFVNKNFCFFDEANPKTENINEYFMSMADQKTIRVERKGIQGTDTPRYTMKVVLSLNKMPYHQPEGFPRRHRHILFERSFTDEGVEDTEILNKVTESEDEMSAVLNRMLDGLDDLRKMGKFTMITGEEERKRDQSISSDTMSEFLDTYFEPVFDGDVRYSYQELKEAYQELFPTHFNKQLSTAGFNKELVNPRLPEFKHIKKDKSNSVRGYTGLKLKTGYKLHQITRHGEDRYTINHDKFFAEERGW